MSEKIKLALNNFNFSYDGKIAVLHDITFDIIENEITAIIGPSGCGKTTLLKCIAGANDNFIKKYHEGVISMDGVQILTKGEAPQKIDADNIFGIVSQSVELPKKTIYAGLASSIKKSGIKNESDINDIIQDTLKKVILWEEVKDRLNESTLTLSLGQQQRLAMALAIAKNPQILLLDCPTSALDPISRQNIEDLLIELKNRFTIIITTNIMGVAARTSAQTLFLYLGQVYEYDKTTKIFTNPEIEETDYFIKQSFV